MISAHQLEFQASAAGQTQNQRLREIFLSRPGQWISMLELGDSIHAWAVHSRVADLRTKFGMTINNRCDRHPITRQRLSSYQYVPQTQTTV